MSLDWNVEAVNPKYAFVDGVCPGELDPIMHALIWCTIGVGLRGITEENKVEFAARLHIYQRLIGPMMTGPDEDYAITADDVSARVGLKVNVADEPRTKWINRIVRYEFIAADKHALEIKKAKLAKQKAAAAEKLTYTRI